MDVFIVPQAMQQLMRHPAHLAAKQRQARWLKGYQVVVCEVIGSYGNRRIPHPLNPPEE
ncbi:hypothetical protein [Bordetella ansorpii]|uniref:hypothetical protein n=1 Tax=Bordetella ansorpii TaxID=288768 RepID=UPI00158E371C|nr:hypothetical protein [Bordetella ansorpii]